MLGACDKHAPVAVRFPRMLVADSKHATPATDVFAIQATHPFLAARLTSDAAHG